MELEFEATGTTWWLRSEVAPPSLLASVEGLVHGYEARLSRFLPESSLSSLNRDRFVDDEVLADVLRLAERIRFATGGAFDVTAGAAVIAAGYDRTFDEIRAGCWRVPHAQRPEVVIEGSSVRLHGNGCVDLGGIAKGWIVDQAADLLSEAGPCVVDGGGDIRTFGGPKSDEWTIGAGDGLVVGLTDGAIATSSILRRRWRTAGGVAHHIIDPARGLPAASGIVNAVVIATTAACADAMATALVVDSARALRALPNASAGALLQHADGVWQMTPETERYLR